MTFRSEKSRHRICSVETLMRFSANNFCAVLAAGALIGPTNAIYAEIASVTPHTTCRPQAPINIAKPSIDQPGVASIPVARAEIASVEVAGKERVGPDTSKEETGPPQPPISLPYPSPSPIGVRYTPEIRQQIEADYERKRPHDLTVDFQRQAATKVDIQIWRSGVSKSGGAYLTAFVTNHNDFALQQITLRCEYVTKDGPKVFFYNLLEVIEPSSLGSATIHYVDHHLGAAPLDAKEADCTPDDVVVWSPGEDIQSRR
jgi:hypothetical protein